MKEKVVLAYSGGLDTTAIIPWLKENFGYEVICCCVDCGQGNELDGLDERAKLSGAAKLYIEDITDDFAENYIMPCVQANAVYENKYLLGTSMARPAIAKKLVEIARKEGASAICHGATGKGNDQIRFELSIKALAPDLKIIAPWRMTDVWTMQSREDEIEYCKKHGIDLPFDHSHSYSRDRNLWHISHEGLELEDPANEPNYDHMLVLGVTPEKAPDEAEYVTMTFEKGVPTSINGKSMKVADIIRELNRLGGKHGIGIVDIVENRVARWPPNGSKTTMRNLFHSSRRRSGIASPSNSPRTTARPRPGCWRTAHWRMSLMLSECCWRTPLMSMSSTPEAPWASPPPKGRRCSARSNGQGTTLRRPSRTPATRRTTWNSTGTARRGNRWKPSSIRSSTGSAAIYRTVPSQWGGA